MNFRQLGKFMHISLSTQFQISALLFIFLNWSKLDCSKISRLLCKDHEAEKKAQVRNVASARPLCTMIPNQIAGHSAEF